HRQHRHFRQRSVALEVGDQVQPGNVLQLDVHDHQIGEKAPRPLDCLIPVGYRFDGETPGLQDVAKKLTVEIVVLDNENSLRHCAPDTSTPRKPGPTPYLLNG